MIQQTAPHQRREQIDDPRMANTLATEPDSKLPSSIERRTINLAVARLDAWLETMHGPGGYGGPVCHWWQQCFTYTGAGLDWRYEGIITGYLNLWQRTGESRWRERAIRAGQDLIGGQQSDGTFAFSGFEMNPARMGTPHEAACDVALLRLASALRQDGNESWMMPFNAAGQNIRHVYLERLWDEERQRISDGKPDASFVPNKAATASNALISLATMSGDAELIDRYAIPTINHILDHQIRADSPFDGAIAQNSFGSQQIDKYFPIYIARCIPALLEAWSLTGSERYIDAAVAAMRFIDRWVVDDGSIPTVVYPDGRTSTGPMWIAPLGDILLAFDLISPFETFATHEAVLSRMLNGQDETGGIQTATKFECQSGWKASELPDVRDLLHVAGWCDKAFRYLSRHVSEDPLPSASPSEFVRSATFLRDEYLFRETCERVEITKEDELRYLWVKGEAHPQVAAKEFWIR